jgi:hypothetical protein
MDPYGLTLVSVEVWGTSLAIMSAGFVVGGIVVARRGLGTQPVRALLLANVAMWTICVLFPIRSSIVLLTIGFMIYTVLIPVVEAAEQTVLQRVVPFAAGPGVRLRPEPGDRRLAGLDVPHRPARPVRGHPIDDRRRRSPPLRQLVRHRPRPRYGPAIHRGWADRLDHHPVGVPQSWLPTAVELLRR